MFWEGPPPLPFAFWGGNRSRRNLSRSLGVPVRFMWLWTGKGAPEGAGGPRASAWVGLRGRLGRRCCSRRTSRRSCGWGRGSRRRRWGSGLARRRGRSRCSVCSWVWGGIEGLDAIGLERADQVLDLVWVVDVPVGMGDRPQRRRPRGSAQSPARQLASGAARRPWRRAPGTPRRRDRGRHLRPAARAMWGRPIESRRRPPDRILELEVEALACAGSRRSPRPG